MPQSNPELKELQWPTERIQNLIVKNDRIRPFRIEVAQEVLSDLRERLKNTRFSYQTEGDKVGLGHRYRLPQGARSLLA